MMKVLLFSATGLVLISSIAVAIFIIGLIGVRFPCLVEMINKVKIY